MEILSYVLSGSLEHRDTMGNHATIRAGEVQLMSAGEGVQHSEFNPSERETAHFLQVWIIPEKKGLKPHYQQKAFPVRDRRNAWQLIASREGSDGSLKIHQQIEIRLAVVEPGGVLRRSFPPGISAWVQVTRGALRLQETVELHAGDGVGCLSESHLVLESLGKEAEVLLFEMP
jgi:redox-sensitive bicupin YhaK (pirin superfamily)